MSSSPKLLRYNLQRDLPVEWRRGVIVTESNDEDEYAERRRLRNLARNEVIKDWSLWRKRLNAFVRSNPWFERFIFLVIALNCFTISTQNFSSLAKYQQAISIAEDVFTVIFFVEMLLKMVGLGVFVRKGGYFHSTWNILDFLIVTMSIVALGIQYGSDGVGNAEVGFTAARSFRLLRPLRSLSVLGSLRTILRAIVASLGRLFNVFLLTVFFTVAAALVGIEAFKNTLQHRCFAVAMESADVSPPAMVHVNATFAPASLSPNTSMQVMWPYLTRVDVGASERICQWSGMVPPTSLPQYINRTSAFYAEPIFRGANLKDLNDIPATIDGFVCTWGEHCLRAQNPERGFLNFDTIMSTALALYSVVSFEEWSPIMYYVMDARGWYVSWYFLTIVLVGTIVILNLAQAIITDTFNRISSLQKAADRRTKSIAPHQQHRVDEDGEKPRSLVETNMLQWSGMILSRSLEEAAKDSPCAARLLGVRRVVYKNVTSKPAFGYFTSFVAFANAVVLATTHHGMNDAWRRAIFVANLAFTAIFGAELLLKAVGEPLVDLVKDYMNIFDFLVTVVAIIEISVSGTAFVTVFRCIRLFKLLQLSEALRSTLVILAAAWKATMSLVLLLVIFIYLFALLGMQLFSGRMCNMDTTSTTRVNTSVCNNVPRSNFDNVGYGVVTTFIIVAGDGWRDIMTDGMVALGEYSAIYFCACYLLGNFLILNLFVAVLLASKEEAEEEEAPELQPQTIVNAAGPEGAHSSLFLVETRGDDEYEMETRSRLSTGDSNDLNTSLLSPPVYDAGAASSTPSSNAFDIVTSMDSQAQFLSIQESRTMHYKRLEEHEQQKILPRRWAGLAVNNPVFTGIVVLTIAFSMISLVISRPLEAPHASPIYEFNNYADLICGLIFALEALLKILHLGLWQRAPPGQKDGSSLLQLGYFQQPWNCFDFVLMLCGIIPVVGFFVSAMPTTVVQSFRLTRGIRPISLIGRHSGLALVFSSLVNSLPSIRNVAFIAVLVWIIYAILGTSLFNGSMYACTADEWGDISFSGPEIRNRTECLERGFAWTTPDENFDNLWNSMVTLFEVATVDNWDSIMFRGVDAVGFDTAPHPNRQPVMIIYFCSYIVIMSFFLINVFTSVMIDTFFDTKSKIEANILHTLTGSDRLLNDDQKEFVRMYRRALLFVKPPLHTAIDPRTLRGFLRRIVRHRQFDNFCLVVAFLQVAIVGSEHLEATPIDPEALFIIDGVFTGFFCVVTVMRIVVLGPVNFLENHTNLLEIAVNATTIATIIAQAVVGDNTTCDIIRNVRLLRLYRIVSINSDMRLLMETLRLSATSLVHVLFILFLLYFTYAVIGMMLFARVKQHPMNPLGVGAFANFERFDKALLTLLRIATVDEWAFVMWDCAIQPPHCDEQLGECGNPALARIYFISFVVLGNWIGLNFFTAVLLDGFSNAEKEARYAIQRRDVRRFQWLWKEFADRSDPNAMETSNLVRFVLKLGRPFGPPIEEGRPPNFRLAIKFVAALNIVSHGNHVTQQPVFDALVRHFYGVLLPARVEDSLRALVDQRFEYKQFERSSPLARKRPFSLHEAASAVVIQAAWRGTRMRRVIEQVMAQNGRRVKLRSRSANNRGAVAVPIADAAQSGLTRKKGPAASETSSNPPTSLMRFQVSEPQNESFHRVIASLAEELRGAANGTLDGVDEHNSAIDGPDGARKDPLL